MLSVSSEKMDGVPLIGSGGVLGVTQFSLGASTERSLNPIPMIFCIPSIPLSDKSVCLFPCVFGFVLVGLGWIDYVAVGCPD